MRNVDGAAVLLVAAGGAAGSVLRYVVGLATQGVAAAFPWGTLGVNVAGSFLLGALLGVLPPGHAGRLLFGAGFCGGFTTFSTFSADAVALAERGATVRAGAYVVASVVLGVLAAAMGAAIGRATAGTR